MSLTSLQYRVLQLSYKHRLSHIGSCLSALPILEEIYRQKRPEEPFILSAGHAGLALYVALEHFCGKDAEKLLLKHGVHPNRDLEDGIDCSTGSLGAGISVSVGRALANRGRKVWCMISDGELAEGVVYESLRYADRAGLKNLQVYLNANGFSALRSVLWSESTTIARTLFPDIHVRISRPESLQIPFLYELDAHYYVMSEQDWNWVQEQEIYT